MRVHFGGEDGLARAWYEAFEEIRATKDRWLVHFILDGLMTAESVRAQLEQSDRDAWEMVRQLIHKQPELAVAAAEQLGGAVLPPDELADDELEADHD